MTVTAAANIKIDTHVHVFERRLRLAPQRRYEPAYEATPHDLLEAMLSADVAKAVLVQPSFLGTDNSYLLEALGHHPGAFAGVAVVEPGSSAVALDELSRAGIVGVRLNCIGEAAPDLSRGIFRNMAERLAAAGLVLEIQAEGAQWLSIAPALGQLPCAVLVDHFGRASPCHGDGGFDSLLAAAKENERVWFKFSGPYRLTDGAAAKCAKKIRAVTGIGRILWGSDWPWT